MLARVTIGQADPARMDEGIARYQQQFLPRFQQATGFRGIWILGDRRTGKILAVSLWESEADMQANESVYQEAIRAPELEVGAPPPTRETYEVLLQA